MTGRLALGVMAALLASACESEPGATRLEVATATERAIMGATNAANPANPAITPQTNTKPSERPMKIESSAFAHEQAIPKRYTCEGQDVSPPLSWSGAPEGTKSFALIMDDPDAPDPAAPKMTWVHWVLYDIPADTESLPEAAGAHAQGARDGKNNWDRTGYGGPCPPKGRHRYFHKIYALDRKLGDLGEPTKEQLEKAMDGHILASAQLMGTYEKKQ